MVIALDATYSIGRNLSGIGVYSRELMWGLARAHPEARFRFCYRPHRLAASFQERLPNNCKRRLLWPPIRIGCDVFHGLNQRIEPCKYPRSVATFHDLFVLTGEYSTPEFRKRFAAQARSAAERADLIIAVSQFTADQVEALLKVEPSRIRVIPHGVRSIQRAEEPLQVQEKIILFVGAIQHRKNVVRLVEAFEQTPEDWKLVLVGANGFGADEILGRIESSPRRRDIELSGYVPDNVLAALYSRASIFAFPSLDEGFGMPVLEAMARGIAVLTSNTSALPEVCGDAALLVDPHSTTAIAEGLRLLISDRQLRQELAHKGRIRSSKYKWETTTQRTWMVYKELTS